MVNKLRKKIQQVTHVDPDLVLVRAKTLGNLPREIKFVVLRFVLEPDGECLDRPVHHLGHECHVCRRIDSTGKKHSKRDIADHPVPDRLLEKIANIPNIGFFRQLTLFRRDRRPPLLDVNIVGAVYHPPMSAGKLEHAFKQRLGCRRGEK